MAYHKEPEVFPINQMIPINVKDKVSPHPQDKLSNSAEQVTYSAMWEMLES